MPRILVLLIAGLTVPWGVAYAQGEQVRSPGERAPRGLVQLRVVNDAFAGADRWYSSHLELAGVGALPGTIEVLHLLLRGGQVMYTPRNIHWTEPPTRDHPFGAWLYADLGALLRRPHGVAMARLRLGALGERAFAEPVQDLMHTLLGVRRPQGWHNQIQNDLGWGIAAGGGAFHRIAIRRWGLVPAAMMLADLGNVQRIVRVGVSLGVLRGPGAAAVEHLAPSLAAPPPGGGLAGGFLFGALVELRAYDRFVEGEGAPVPPDIDARPATMSFRLGGRIRWWRRRPSGRLAAAGWELAYIQAWRMRTFDNVPPMELHPAWHRWGELEVRAFF